MLEQDKIFEEHINIISEEVNKAISSVKSIILYGGYGRNEGSWYQNSDGVYKPYNDYDILLVNGNKVEPHVLSTLKKKILKKINIKWIDLSQKSTTELKSLKPSIFNYDLKYASKVISGQKNILENIPEFDASMLPLEEANILFRTRMWTLLGSLDGNGFKSNLTGDDSRFFRNQMAKAILSIVDICLLQKGAYHYSYKERVKRFQELYEYKKELSGLSKWALSEKLAPKAPIMDKNEVLKLYSQVHKLYLNEMFVALGKRFNTKITTPEKLVVLWKYYPINISRRIAYLLIKRSMQYEKSIILDMIQLYLLMAYNKEGFKNNYLLKANYLLKMLNNTINLDIAWDEARLIVAQMRLA